MNCRKNINTVVSLLLFYVKYDNFPPVMDADPDDEGCWLKARVRGGDNEVKVSVCVWVFLRRRQFSVQQGVVVVLSTVVVFSWSNVHAEWPRAELPFHLGSYFWSFSFQEGSLSRLSNCSIALNLINLLATWGGPTPTPSCLWNCKTLEVFLTELTYLVVPYLKVGYELHRRSMVTFHK